MVGLSHGLMVRWFDCLIVRWSDGPTIRWSDGGGPMGGRSDGLRVRGDSGEGEEEKEVENEDEEMTHDGWKEDERKTKGK